MLRLEEAAHVLRVLDQLLDLQRQVVARERVERNEVPTHELLLCRQVLVVELEVVDCLHRLVDGAALREDVVCERAT